jgi:predicted exporter
LILLGFISTALGIVCALAVTMAVFGQIHLLTLVFGASLIGEAVDYSIQYFVLYRGETGTWHAHRAARAVRPALTVALVTSLLGYAMLMWVPFPALKQIACFAIVGIVTAFASVMWLLPSILVRGPKRPAPRLFAAASRCLPGWHRAIGGRRALRVVALLFVLCVPGWLQLTSDDDVRVLVARDPVLLSQEHQVRDAIGADNGAQFFLVRGDTPEAVLQRAEALDAALSRLSGAASLRGWQSLASFVPSIKRQEADRALLAKRVFDDPAALRARLDRAGFRDDVITGWLAAYAGSGHAVLTIDQWLRAPWSQPFRHLWLGRMDTAPQMGSAVYATVVLPQGVTEHNVQVLSRTAASLPGVTFVDKAASVSALFGRYRAESGWWLAGALCVVLILLSIRYGIRGGVSVVVPVLLAVGITLAAFGYVHVPVNLFNCLALMLVLGVGANYAVFLREGCVRPDANLGAVWSGVLLSAATTLLSFGLLALSAMPALRSFGATLALGIAVSVLFAPIGMTGVRDTTGVVQRSSS